MFHHSVERLNNHLFKSQIIYVDKHLRIISVRILFVLDIFSRKTDLPGNINETPAKSPGARTTMRYAADCLLCSQTRNPAGIIVVMLMVWVVMMTAHSLPGENAKKVKARYAECEPGSDDLSG